MVNTEKITAFINALNNKFEAKSNKKDDISGDFSSDTNSYPTVKAIKAFVTNGLSGKVDKVNGKQLSTEDFTSAEKTKLSGIEEQANKTTVDSALDSTSSNPVRNSAIYEALESKASSSSLATVATTGAYSDLSGTPSLATVATSGSYDDLSDTPTLADVATSGAYSDLTGTPTLANVATSGAYSDLSGAPDLTDYEVTVEKQTTAETGYAHTYVVKQDGVQVGDKINIPKDYLVKSGSVQTVGATGAKTAQELGTGYTNGDKYIDFVVNTKGNDGTDEHIYINVKDLVEDTTYTADDSTLQLSNGQFSVKAGGITTTELASGVVTSLGYADAFNSSAAAGITSSDITAWNAKSDLTTANVDSEIESYLDALTTALTPSS